MKVSLEMKNSRRSFGLLSAVLLLAATSFLAVPAYAVTETTSTDTATPAVAPIAPAKPVASTKRAKVSALPAVQVDGAAAPKASAKPPLKPVAQASFPGPYYVDFRARTAASYGHAFIWYGKSSEKAVDVAGLHPATDSVVPYIMGHLVFVESETGASYGDLDEEYLTANYRVYLSAEDAPKVFAYIHKLQATTPFWNATTTNCTWFIGQIAKFMGLKIPPNIYFPEEWVNETKKLNGSRDVATLSSEQN